MRKFIKAVKHTINRPTSELVSSLFEMNDALACNMLKKHQYNHVCLCVCVFQCGCMWRCGCGNAAAIIESFGYASLQHERCKTTRSPACNHQANYILSEKIQSNLLRQLVWVARIFYKFPQQHIVVVIPSKMGMTGCRRC